MSDPRIRPANLLLMEKGTSYVRPITIITVEHPRLFWRYGDKFDEEGKLVVEGDWYYFDKRIGSTYVYGYIE